MVEKFMGTETVTSEPSSSGPLSQKSPKTPNGNLEDSDFNNVFGGPPRRYSIKEARVKYSFSEIVGSEDDGISSPWRGRKERPAFRAESLGRNRYPSDDFFDDIFRGDECYGSPRSFDRDSVIGSSPSFRIMSPVSGAEVFGTSLPPQLSLTSRSTTPKESSPYAPQNHGQFKMDGTANQLNSSRSSSSSSRFYHQSPLASFSTEDSSSTVPSDNVKNFKKDTRSMESLTDENQFHFSIYKWAGRGVPLLTLVDRRNFKNTGRSDRVASTNGRIRGDFTNSKLSKVANQDFSANIEPEFFKTKCGSEDSRIKEEKRKLEYSVEEAPRDILESKTPGIAENCVSTHGATQYVETEAVKLLDETDKVNKVENKVPVNPEAKPLRACLVDDVEQQGNMENIKENEIRAAKVDIRNGHDSKSVKKNEEKQTDIKKENVDKSNLKRGENSSTNLGRSGAKSKVKEFVQIFNHEADSRPKPDVPKWSQSCRGKGHTGIHQKENEMNVNESKVKEKANEDKNPDVSLKAEKNLNKDEVPSKPQTKNPNFQMSFRRDSKISVENPDDPCEDYFSVQELSPDHEDVRRSTEDSEEMKAIDAKILQWAVGKNGNIRSLLSTLQFVLWPGNGWKPVALADLIETNAVKRAYQKALLRLHPDKLQQNGSASDQKYIAEKVFDLLQEAWDHFNAL